MKNHNKAFTLIEVLIVTAVISLLASIVNAQMGETRQKAEDAHMKTETQQVRNAVEQYRQRTGSVPIPQKPEGGNYTGAMVQEGTTQYRTAMQQLVAEKLIPEIPTSPSGQSYSYLATDDTKEAVFAAVLNNDSSGGSGGSSTNSCEVVESGIDLDTCYQDAEAMNCADVTYDEQSQFCIDNFSARDYCDYNYEDCRWFSIDTNMMNDSYCNIYKTYDHCTGFYSGSASPSVCEYTGSVCSGASNSDYCSCI